MMPMHLEHYLYAVQHLPVQLKRNFNSMRDLDVRVQQLMKRIDLRSNLYLSNIKFLSPENKKVHYGEIQNLFNKAKEYADSKIQLAIHSYELVDRQIRGMDYDLERLTAQKQGAPAKKPKAAKKCRKRTKKRARARSSDEDSDGGRGRKRRKKKPWGDAGRASSSSADDCEDTNMTDQPEIDEADNVYDMPVDPNEPTYCLCHQVSYGEMIGCDNQDCTIEWFHFPCVGLTAKPMGEWFCPRCTAERKSKVKVEWYCPKCAAARK